VNFLIVGPGAMGCLFAARLTKGGHHVTLLDHREERARFINDHGIHVEGVTGDYTVGVEASTGEVSPFPDVVLICVKANQTRSAAQALKGRLGPDSWILTVQNGLGNFEILEEELGKGKVLGGVTAEGATLLDQGHVRHAGQGETIVGPKGPPDSPVEKIVEAFNKAGFSSRTVEKVEDIIWGKLIINVGINALTAITGLKNGRLPALEGTRAVMEGAVKEAVAVAREKEIHLPYPDPLARVTEVCHATAENIASMLQDVLHKRPTEVGFINGAIVTEGKKLGIPTPINQTLARLVQAIQETYGERLTGS